jgi:hypothetical protein
VPVRLIAFLAIYTIFTCGKSVAAPTTRTCLSGSLLGRRKSLLKRLCAAMDPWFSVCAAES